MTGTPTGITQILRLAAARGFISGEDLIKWRTSGESASAEPRTAHYLVEKGLLTDTQLAELRASASAYTRQQTETVSGTARSRRGELLGPPVIPGYEITAVLGQGGAAIVYHAWQERPRREVAIKVLKAGILAEEEARARFIREAEAAASLSHPAIVSIYEFGEADGVPYFSMELVRGMRLDRYVEFQRLPLRERLSLMLRVCQGVAHAHQRGVIHRDLKPSNILVDDAGQPKIMDFGIAKLLSPDAAEEPLTQTETGHFIGTVAYMAPEQTLGRADAVDTRTDVYALGAVLYQILTGKLPHWTRKDDVLAVVKRINGEPPVRPTTLNRAVSLDVESIILKALEKEKERRYQSADAFADDIARYLAGEPVQARRGATTYYLRKWAYRHRTFIALVSAALMAVVTVAAWSFVTIRHERNAALKAEAETRAAKERIERDDYWTKVNLVASRLRERAHRAAARLLESCPPSLRHWEWGYLLRQCQPELRVLRAPSGGILSATFAQRGAAVAASSPDGTVYVWDIRTGRTLRSFATSPGAERHAAAFRADGTTLLVPEHGCSAAIWDVSSGNRTMRLTGHAAPVQGGVFSADGTKALTWDSAGTAIVWNAGTGDRIGTLETPLCQILGAALSSDGSKAASVGKDRRIATWDLVGGPSVPAITPPDQHAVNSVCFSPDDRMLATGGSDATVRLWDMQTGRELVTLEGHTRAVVSVAFGPEGTALVTGSADQTVRVWDLATRQQLAVLAGHDAPVVSAAISPGRRHVLATGTDGTTRVWELSEKKDRLDFATLRFHLVALSRDCRSALGAPWFPDDGWHGVVFDTIAERVESQLGPHEGFVESGAFSPDSARAATMDATGRVRIWDTAGGQEIASFPALKGSRLHPYAWDPQGKLLLAVGTDGKAHVWDAYAGDDLGTLSADGACGASFDPEGRRAVTAHYDAAVRAWDVANRQVIAIIRGHSGAVSSAAFSPDGRLVVTASQDTTARVWDAQTGAEVATLRGHDEPVQYASFSPDGRRVVSVGRSGIGKLWDWENERELVTLSGPDVAPPFSVVFSQDGRRIVMAGPGQMLVHLADEW